MKKLSFILISLLFLMALPALAAPVTDGWERDGKYNHFFDSRSMVSITGQITKIDREYRPLPDMAVGLAVTVKTKKGKSYLVEVGPSWFTSFFARKWDVKVGDTVDIRGSEVTIEDKPVIMAVWGKKGDLAMTVRSLKGAPVWDLEISDF